MKCIHLAETPGWRPEEDGSETEIVGHLCNWADAHPERLLNMPRWLSTWALSGGPNFNPIKHCQGCPGYDRERD